MQAMLIQPSPHCSSLNKKKKLNYKLNTLHQTLHNTLTIHSKHAKCHKSLNSQYRCLYTDRRCLSIIRLRPSHNFLFLNNQTCCLDTFVTKARFYRFFLHQTQSKRDGNVHEKAWRTLFAPLFVHRLGRWAMYIYRFRFHFVVRASPDLLRPE